MNIVIGLVGLVLVLGYVVNGGHGHAFNGLLFVPAVVLLSVAPLCVAVISYRFEDLWSSLRALGRAFRFSAQKSRQRLFTDLSRFAVEVRRQRPAEALAVAEASSHEVFRQLAPLVVRQYSAQDIEQTAQTATTCHASALKRAEDVFGTLARVAPATGLVGTVLGLISLLKDLSRFEQLGPSMALALLCTLYGLLLANAVYQPLGRLIHSYATVTVEESRLLARALGLLAAGKSLADLRRLFELTHGQTAAATAAPELAAGSEG